MHLACCLFRLTMEEAFIGATLNAAASIGRGRTHGALAKGRIGDILLVDAPDWKHIIYQFVHTFFIFLNIVNFYHRFGCAPQLIKKVIKRGIVVVDNE
jgi:hypothetical protein